MDLDFLMDQVSSGASSGRDSLDALMDEVSAGYSSPSAVTEDDFSIWDFGAQVGSGLVEGTTETVDFLDELNPMKPGGPSAFGLNPFAQESKSLTETVSPYLAEEDPDYRYTREISRFVSPGVVSKAATLSRAAKRAPDAVAKALQWLGNSKAIGTDALAGTAYQATEDYAPESKALPILAAIGTGLAPSAIKAPFASGRQGLKNIVQDTSKKAAGDIVAERTGMVADDIPFGGAFDDADDIGQYRTTAERTNNAGMAQLEKEFTKSGRGAQRLADRVGPEGQRTKAREGLLSDLSETKQIGREEFGSRFKDAGQKSFDEITELEGTIWEGFQRDIPVRTSSYKGALQDAIEAHQPDFGTGGVRGELRQVIDQFMDGMDPTLGAKEPGWLSSGRLQKMRETALKIVRKNDSPNGDTQEKALAGAFANILDQAAQKQLPKSQYDIWKKARDLTSQKKTLFGQGTPGAAAIDPQARPSEIVSRIFKGDKKSIDEASIILAERPELIEDYKRAVLNLMKTDAGGRFTTSRVKSFLERNESGIEALFGERGKKQIQTLLDDLQSQDKVRDLAFKASEGIPATAQSLKVSNVIRGALSKKVPFTGIAGDLIEGIIKNRQLRTEAQIEEYLLEAIFDPEVARELLKTASEETITSALSVLGENVIKSIQMGAREGGIASALAQSPETERSQPQTSLEAPNPQGRRQRPIERGVQEGRSPEAFPSPQREATAPASQEIVDPVFDLPFEESVFDPASEQSVFDQQQGEAMGRTSERGINLIKEFEGFRGAKYEDVAGVPTIGFGHTGDQVGRGEISEEEAEQILRQEDLPVYEDAVERLVKVPLKQNEFDALVSLVYNIGPGAFAQSTLLKKLNAGDKEGAAREFGNWINAGGKPVKGLKRRRAAERVLFLA